MGVQKGQRGGRWQTPPPPDNLVLEAIFLQLLDKRRVSSSCRFFR